MNGPVGYPGDRWSGILAANQPSCSAEAVCSCYLQLGGGRGIVRGQTFIPNETGKRTFLDVVSCGHARLVLTRRGEKAFPVCPQSDISDLLLILSGTPLQIYFIQGDSQDNNFIIGCFQIVFE